MKKVHEIFVILLRLILKWSPLTEKQKHWVEFLHAMTIKEVKAQYKSTFLGFFWVLLSPILKMIIMGFVFSFFVPVEVDNYFLFLFTGLLPWGFFSGSISKATPVFYTERNLIQKSNFPREIVVLSIIFSNLFHFLVAISLLGILLIGDKLILEAYSFERLIHYSANMLWALPLVGFMTFFTSGIALFTSSINVRFRDTSFIVNAVLPLWFYGTPIVYSLKLLPEKFYPIFYLNPMTAVIEGLHNIFLNLPPASIDLWKISYIVGVVLFYVGWVTFLRENKWFDDWM